MATSLLSQQLVTNTRLGNPRRLDLLLGRQRRHLDTANNNKAQALRHDMGTPHMQKSSEYMVRRTARQMRVKLTACLEASHSHSSSLRQTPSAPVRPASCQCSVLVAKVLTNGSSYTHTGHPSHTHTHRHRHTHLMCVLSQLESFTGTVCGLSQRVL